MPSPPTSYLDLLQYVAVTRYTTKLLCRRFLGCSQPVASRLISRLISDSMIEVVRVGPMDILLITHHGLGRVAVRADMTFPKKITHDKLPGQRLHHDLYVQYVVTQLCNRHDLARYSFNYPASDKSIYRPGAMLDHKDDRPIVFIELEMAEKSNQRVYMKFMDIYRELVKLNGLCVMAFPSIYLRNKYYNLFRNEWPVYSREGSRVVRSSTYSPTADVLDVFKFTTIQELDGKHIDHNRVY